MWQSGSFGRGRHGNMQRRVRTPEQNSVNSRYNSNRHRYRSRHGPSPSNSGSTPPRSASANLDITGHDLHFLDSTDRYTCPICLFVLRSPVQTPCGHRFCKECFESMLSVRQAFQDSRVCRCPVDKEEIDTTKVYTDSACDREVLSLRVRCERTADGCVWEGELRSHETHLVICPGRPVLCPLGCGVVYTQHEQSTHLARCEQRIITCQYCETGFEYTEIEGHRNTCVKAPVPCPDCEQSVMRGELEVHRSVSQGSCPSTLVPCHYSDIGCTAKVARCSREMHSNEQLVTHFDLLYKGFQRLQLEIQTKKEGLG